MTESFGPYCGDRLDRDLPDGKEGSCGRPFADVEVRVVDPDTGEPVAAGVVGEIQLRGPNLMRGICGRVRSDVFTADGFYPTGDLGMLDDDGYVFFRGRPRRHVQGARARASTRARSRPRCALPEEIDRAFVVDVERDGVPAVGAVVVLAPDARRQRRGAGCRRAGTTELVQGPDVLAGDHRRRGAHHFDREGRSVHAAAPADLTPPKVSDIFRRMGDTAVPGLDTECTDGVLRVRLARPEKRNAIDDAMMYGLIDAIDAAGRDDTVPRSC